MRERDVSIDFIRFVAVLLITNSHMNICYERCSFLATGGALGDALFFFCSGYTLLLSKKTELGLLPWYKNRLARIWPSVFGWAILCGLLYGQMDSALGAALGGAWFTRCILGYYLVFYFIKKWLSNRLELVVLLFLPLSFGWYYFCEPQSFIDGVYMHKAFFIFMLLGAWAGHSKSRVSITPILIVCVVGLSVFAFYCLAYFSPSILRPFALLPLVSFCWAAHCLAKVSVIERIMRTRVGWLMASVGGLSLEVYLVQPKVFSDSMNFLFPINLPIIFALIVVYAYVVRCFARMFAQTWDKSITGYDWPKIFKVGV